MAWLKLPSKRYTARFRIFWTLSPKDTGRPKTWLPGRLFMFFWLQSWNQVDLQKQFGSRKSSNNEFWHFWFPLILLPICECSYWEFLENIGTIWCPMQQLLKWYFPQCSATCSLAMYIAPYFPIASWICECSNPNFSLETSGSRFEFTGKLLHGGAWQVNCLTVYIRTLCRTLARQSGQVARACWQDEHEQRWPHGRKIISHWKKEDKF